MNAMKREDRVSADEYLKLVELIGPILAAHVLAVRFSYSDAARKAVAEFITPPVEGA